MKQILVLEDELLVAEHVAAEVSKFDAEAKITRCSSYAEVSEALKSINPDLAICDIRLEEEPDGIECAKLIRKKSKALIVFLTAFSDDETIQKTLPVFPDAFLTKPFNSTQIAATLTSLYHSERKRHNLGNGSLDALSNTVREIKVYSDKLLEHSKSEQVQLTSEKVNAFVSDFELFKKAPSRDLFEDLLTAAWVSSLKLKKVNELEILETDVAKSFFSSIELVIMQFKQYGEETFNS